MADDPQANIRIGADDEPLRRSLRELLNRMTAFGNESKTQLTGVGTGALGLRDKLMGVATALSGAAVVAFMKRTIDLQDELSKAAQKAGTTTEAFSGMNYAAKLADVSTQELTRGYSKVNGLLTEGQAGKKEAVALLKSIGVDPKKLQDSDQLLLILAERFEGMADGARKGALASAVFGERLGPGLIPFLNQGRGGIEELRKEAERLGDVSSTEQGKRAEEFNDNLTRLGTAAQGAANQVMKSLLPALEEASSYFVKATKDAGLLQGTLISIGALFAKVLGKDEEGQLQSRVRELEDRAHRLGVVKQNLENLVAMRPDNKNAQADLAAIRAQIETINAQAQQARQALMGLHAGSSQAGAGRGVVNPPLAFPAKPGGTWEPPPSGGAAKAIPSEMARYQLMLAEEKRIQSLLTSGREYSKQQELDFWRALLQTQSVNANDRTLILRRAAELEVDITRKRVADQKALEAENLEASEQLALARVDSEEAAAHSAHELGQITQGQLLALQRLYEQQRFEIAMNGLAERLRLVELDPDASPEKKAQALNALVLLQERHNLRMASLAPGGGSRQGLFDQAKGNLAAQLGDEGMWSGMFNRILSQAWSWRSAMATVYNTLRDIFVRTMVVEPLANYAAAQAKMLMVKMGFLSAEKGAQATATAGTVAMKATETTAVVGANAAQAGSGAASSVASIPYVGPILALAAMAAVFAAVMGLSRKSAAGGYDIPAGVNPVTQLHEEEMVLPSPISNFIRERMAEGGGGGGGGDQAAVVFKSTPLPGGFLVAMESDFVRFIKDLQRNRRI